MFFFEKKNKILEITWDVCYCFDLRSDSYSLSPQTWQGVHLNFVDCESFLESNSPDILALCETNVDDSIDSGNFSLRAYLPLFGKDSSNHIHGLTVYMMEGLPYSDLVVSVSIDFPSYAQQDALFHRIAYDYSCANWDSLCDHLRDVPWEDIFKLSASDAASEFCEWVQVGIDVYIPHRKNQVKPHLPPWFSAVCAAAIVHRNHFFCLYQKDKSSEPKVKFRQASNRCKRVFEAAKLTYANKTKESITSQKLGSQDFWQIASSVLNKVNLLYFHYSMVQRGCLLHLIKQTCLLKTYLKTLVLMTQLSRYSFSFLELI